MASLATGDGDNVPGRRTSMSEQGTRDDTVRKEDAEKVVKKPANLDAIVRGAKRSSTASVIKEGYLYKRPMSGKKSSWKKRYFVLQRDENAKLSLLYFEKKGSKKAKGSLTLESVGEAAKWQDEKGKQKFAIIIDVKGAQLFAAAESEEVRQSWIDTIREGVMGVREAELARRGRKKSISEHSRPPPPSVLRPSFQDGPKPPPRISAIGPPPRMSLLARMPSNDVAYAWGDNRLGQVGYSMSQHQCCSTPMILSSLRGKNAAKAAFSGATANHSLIVTAKEQSFCFGDGAYFQLGCGPKLKSSARPFLVGAVRSEKAQEGAAGLAHSMLVLENGSVLTAGTSTCGALGLGDGTTQVDTFTPIPTFGPSAGVAVAFVSCGLEHSAFVSMGGAAYTCGAGAGGRLGLGTEVDVMEPTKIKDLLANPVLDVACGGSFTILITKEGEVFECGIVQMDGGAGSDKPGVESATAIIDGKTPVERLVPVYVPLPGSNGAKAISAGRGHAAVLAMTEGDLCSVYTWGSGDHGCLGNGTEQALESPIAVKCFQKGQPNEANLISVSCGMYHTAVLADDHRLYTWGRGQDGQLGNGYFVDAAKPVLVQTPSKEAVHFIGVSCGRMHTIGMTAPGLPDFDPDNYPSAMGVPEQVQDHHQDAGNQLAGMLSQMHEKKDDIIKRKLEEDEKKKEEEEEQVHAATVQRDPTTGKRYSYNSATGESAWLPEDAMKTNEELVQSCDHQGWQYRDVDGNVFGPFSTEEMKDWYQDELIFDNLEVRPYIEDEKSAEPYILLGELMPKLQWKVL
eukprot:g2114.t1